MGLKNSNQLYKPDPKHIEHCLYCEQNLAVLTADQSYNQVVLIADQSYNQVVLIAGQSYNQVVLIAGQSYNQVVLIAELNCNLLYHLSVNI